MQPSNNRSKLWSQSLELMDDILHLGTIERFAWAGATAADRGDPLDFILEQLNRVELKKQINANNDLYRAVDAVQNQVANHANFFNLAMEANRLVVEAYAKRLGIHDAFICLEGGLSPISSAQKVSKSKTALLKGEQ